MRTILAAAFSLAAASAVAAADFPADRYYTAPAPLSAAGSWAGPYLGANIGYELATVDNNPTKPSGIAGGIQAGYNWQRGQFVFGGEADFQLSAADATVAPWQFSNPWFGTVRGRAGVAFNNVLVYGTAGLAYGDLRLDTAGLTESHASIGWTAGAGIEVGFTPRWSARAEWLYLDLMDRGFSGTGANNGLAANLIRFGVNYHF